MMNPKYLDVSELAQIVQIEENTLIDMCCNERLPYLGIPIEPMFKFDELMKIKEIIRKEVNNA